MNTTQQRARRRQQLESLCAATIRALCNDPRLRYRGHRLYGAGTSVPGPAPHLRVSDDDDLAAYRGAADGMALRLLYSDTARHRQRAPDTAVARLIFDWLEQLRVESLTPSHLPGLNDNISKRFAAWSHAFVNGSYLEDEIGETIYTLILLCRARLLGRPVPADSAALIEARHGAILSRLGHTLGRLRDDRHDQEAFAAHALIIANFMADQVAAALENPASKRTNNDKTPLATLLDIDDESNQAPDAANHAVENTASAGNALRYRVFTTAHDSEQAVTQLVRPQQLADFRARLDRALDKLHVNQQRLARYFRARLSVADNNDWRFGEEEGYIDGRRLAQIVATPTERRVFTVRASQPRPDTVVSLLLDCSGSMKAHAEFLALVVDRIAGALAMATIPCEILGFTTGAWSGGRSRRDWLQEGQPAFPGRLNEVCHLVFKPVHAPWRRARRNLGGLLKRDIYREGIDGEAVTWACTRLSASVASRRILIVISDGSPMDSATQLANDSHYLDSHLRSVVTEQARQGTVEIRALGVGLDLSTLYDDSLIIDPGATIDNNLLGEIAAFIAGK